MARVLPGAGLDAAKTLLQRTETSLWRTSATHHVWPGLAPSQDTTLTLTHNYKFDQFHTYDFHQMSLNCFGFWVRREKADPWCCSVNGFEFMFSDQGVAGTILTQYCMHSNLRERSWSCQLTVSVTRFIMAWERLLKSPEEMEKLSTVTRTCLW